MATPIPRHRRRRSGRSAQVLVETALLVPVMIALLGLGVAIGQTVGSAVDLTNAARAGALTSAQDWYTYCIQTSNPCGSETIAQQQVGTYSGDPNTNSPYDVIYRACAEQQYPENLDCLTDGSGTDMTSVVVTFKKGASSGQPIAVVQISAQVQSLLPFIPTIHLTVQAAAEEEE